MNDSQPTTPCTCTICPGAPCGCGCQSAPSQVAAQAATQATCACGAECRCGPNCHCAKA